MTGTTVSQDRARHRDRLFGVIRRLADPPLIPLAGIVGNYVSWPAVESS
jgi:hypothetical protein